MMGLPTETLHASTVALEGRAVLLAGASGTGKSDLALRLIDRGFILVSDDQTVVCRDKDRLLAAAPANIRGKLEIRGIGIVNLETAGDVPVALCVELTREIERLPDAGRTRRVLDVDIPLVSIDAMTASAPAKVTLALDRLGLRF